jgi:mRNA interferase MazF
MIIRPGDYWVADIPYTDGSASKKRPILVLWLDGEDVVTSVVTSAAPRTPTDVSLEDWRQSGLRVASTVRLSRLDCLEQSLLTSRLGHVTEKDGRHLKETWAAHIRLEF